MFLLTLFNSGLSYSSLNTARSALSSILPSIDGIPVGQHPFVIRFLKGVFESRPVMPHYTAVWDVNQVLDYLKTLSPVNEISLESLTLKLTMLLALVTAQRGQSLLFLNVDSMIDSWDAIHEHGMWPWVRSTRRKRSACSHTIVYALPPPWNDWHERMRENKAIQFISAKKFLK